MIILLNGPLGIGKSTLAEALAESIDLCVMLDGDHLVAANPPPADEQEHLHATIYHCLGIDPAIQLLDPSGRVVRNRFAGFRSR